MATLVTLDVFSGRPNPTFQLTPEQEHQLSERLHAMTAFTTAHPSGVKHLRATGPGKRPSHFKHVVRRRPACRAT
jgi:hypothetical protein